MSTWCQIPAVTLEKELAVLKFMSPIIEAMIVANTETESCFSSGSTFWIEQQCVAEKRIQEIEQLLSQKGITKNYVYHIKRAEKHLFVSFKTSAWPTHSKQLASENESYFFVPEGWVIFDETKVDPLMIKDEAVAEGFSHIGGFSQ